MAKQTRLGDALRRKNVKLHSEPLIIRPNLLLCPNTPKPLHGVVPREILGRDWWDKTRNEAYKSTGYHCAACGVYKGAAKFKKWLEGHEIYDMDYPAGRATYTETVALCHCCHNFIHDGRLKALADKGEILLSKYDTIIQHGTELLRLHGLIKVGYSGPIADWRDWRLVLNGVEYPPKFATYEDWLNHFYA